MAPGTRSSPSTRSQPAPAGRGQSVARCPVQVAAEAMGLPVHSPVSLKRDPAAQAAFAALRLDAAVVAAYGLILPQAMLDAPRCGCLKHPRQPAAALARPRRPIQAAVLAGDEETGITIMQMDAGLDTGAMLLRGSVKIGPRETASGLHDTLASLGAVLVLRALAERPALQPQPGEGASYAPKLFRADGVLDWTWDAARLDRQVRGLNPWPGTVCRLGAETLKVLEAEPAEGHGPPGTVLEGLTVACGTDALRLLRVQPTPARAPMAADMFLRGLPVAAGTILGAA